MSGRMNCLNCRTSIAADRCSRPSPSASIQARAQASIPFRRKTKIGQASPGMGETGDLVHLVGGQLEIEDVEIFGETLDARGTRNHASVLLHQPAQANLRRALAVRPADLRQGWVVL